MKAYERHRLKHDKYAESVVQGMAWAQRHQNVIAAVLVAFLVVFGGTLYLKWTRQTSRNSAADILGEIEAQAQRAVLEDPEKRPDAINQALSRYDSLAAAYPETSSAKLALVQAGGLLVKSGQPARAISYFDRAISTAGKGAIADLGRRGKAVALEASGDYRRAIENYSYFAGDSTTLEGVQANWDIGRCYELLGETDQARAYYEKAAQYGEDSDWAQMARFRLSEMARGAAALIQPEPKADEAAPEPPVAEPGGEVSVEPKGSAPPPASPEAPMEAPVEEVQAAGSPESAPDTVESPAAP